MTWTSLGNPRLRAEPRQYTPVSWEEGPLLAFSTGSGSPVPRPDGQQDQEHRQAGLVDEKPPFDTLIGTRRTRYGFQSVSLGALDELFSLTCRVALCGPSTLGFALSQRPAPSAGAIHPVHVVVHLPGHAQLHRYDPYGHGLRALTCSVDPEQLRRAMNDVVGALGAVLLMFVAEPAKTMAKYEAGSSLVWRDAGVLQGYFSLAAEALSLNFVPLGVTGDPWAARLVDQPGLVGVGAAFVGARV
ncbi:SagB/ThcOx family dehydrogenase [Trinickia dinghuensis]|uniref:SagB/ThcOx family dehydrogenase n=1 Tax=Trinickia dinghuensis TaxID=2291023 RepID=UPI0011C0275B|nr:SagB/ThcOx family dehydrogenase [Trinickia dinghuensis]